MVIFMNCFNRFRKKYDCDYYTKNGSIIFSPAFSNVKNTYWEKITDKRIKSSMPSPN